VPSRLTPDLESGHGHDAQQGKPLAVTVLAAIVVAAALLEHHDLFRLGLRDDLGRNRDLGRVSQFAVLARKEDARVIVSPASPASFSTAILSPAATR
jgi:hypothetical protein